MATRTKGKYTSGLKSNSFGSYEDFEGHKKGEAQGGDSEIFHH